MYLLSFSIVSTIAIFYYNNPQQIEITLSNKHIYAPKSGRTHFYSICQDGKLYIISDRFHKVIAPVEGLQQCSLPKY